MKQTVKQSEAAQSLIAAYVEAKTTEYETTEAMLIAATSLEKKCTEKVSAYKTYKTTVLADFTKIKSPGATSAAP